MAAGMKRARVAEEDDCKLFIDKYRKTGGVMAQAKLVGGIGLIEQILGRKYHDKAWGMAALDFTQYVMRGDDKLDSPAERLALIGDNVMDFELCLVWDGGEFSRDSWQKEKDVTLTNKRFSSILRANAALIRCVQYRGTANVRLIQLSNHDEGTLAESLVGSAWKDEFDKTQSYDRAFKVMRNAMAKLNNLPRNDRKLFVHHDGRASTATANRMAKRDPIIALKMFRTVKAATAAVVTTTVHAQPENSQFAVSQESAEALRAIPAPHMSVNMSTTRSTAPAVIPSANPSTASLSLATARGTFVSDSGTQAVTRTPLSTIKTNPTDMFVFTADGTPLVKTSARTNKIQADLEAKGYVDKEKRSTATNDPDTSAKIQTAPSSDSPESLPLTKSSSPAYTSASAQTPATSLMAVGSVDKEKADIVTVREEARDAATSKDISRGQQNREHERGTLDDNKENERRPDVAVEDP